jgi:hypothetical protein
MSPPPHMTQEDIRTAILTINTHLLNTDKLLALKMMLPSPVHTCQKSLITMSKEPYVKMMLPSPENK